MALQILEKNGTFELKGNLTTTTTRSFIIHFEYLLKTMKNITVNIDKVDEIDSYGVAALKNLISHGMRSNNRFSIIGYGCKDIYDEFRVSFAA